MLQDTRAGEPPSKRSSITLRVFWILILLAASESQIYGFSLLYTDPGSGALIWQILVAGFVGAAFYLRRFVSWLKSKKGNKLDD